MTFDDFMNTIKTIDKIPFDFFARRIINGILFSSSYTHQIFFGGLNEEAYCDYNKDKNINKFVDLSVKYLSYVILNTDVYSFNKTITAIKYDYINDWFNANSKDVGHDLFIDYMMTELNMKQYVDDSCQWTNTITEKIATDHFITDFLIECDTKGTNLPPMALLIFMKILDSSGDSYNKVIEIWSKNKRWQEISNYNDINWFETVSPFFSQSTENFEAIKNYVLDACRRKTGPYNVKKREVVDITSSGAPIVANVNYHKTIYGEDVLKWIDSDQGANGHGFRSGKRPNNETLSKAGGGGGSGCVLKGTTILMADGTSKAVEDIREYDRVINENSEVSVCSSELVINPHVTKLYSFNEDKPFMSFDHAVMTDRGWCSLNPEISNRINPHFNVKKLEIGDNVWKVKEIINCKIIHEKVIVKKINIIEAPNSESFLCYDLHFRHGYQSYHANGYCNLLNYPEITVNRIISNMNKRMTEDEKNVFVQNIINNKELFEKAFGVEGISSISDAFTKLLS
ncbi:hypothetical protein [Abyssisolibacter fermentans]|uniref:hypothetical protein n=1 Tax=Abyssisolibacter fermentans TaxID=1766203 RepID=UPI000834DCA4|nr:hypothetical protein [Abyssisolibacter fermentans]